MLLVRLPIDCMKLTPFNFLLIFVKTNLDRKTKRDCLMK